jgi:hypothetical protein
MLDSGREHHVGLFLDFLLVEYIFLAISNDNLRTKLHEKK